MPALCWILWHAYMVTMPKSTYAEIIGANLFVKIRKIQVNSHMPVNTDDSYFLHQGGI